MKDRLTFRYVFKLPDGKIRMVETSLDELDEIDEPGDSAVKEAPMGWELKARIQCTGRRDEAGKLAYEGDIVRGGLGLYVIEWEDEYAGFHLVPVKPSRHAKRIDHLLILRLWKVIGNIYQHPELLEKNK